ncbi:MAG: hypothetical protein K2X47_20595, partial [Bdellovibrionales bacterium]|nr:hypothetical protein [Bdellovibrionales bacterium]
MPVFSIQRLLIVVFAISSASCTREVAKDNSSLSFRVPETFSVAGKASVKSKSGSKSMSSVSALDAVLGHVVINVTGPGMPPLICHFEKSRNKKTGPCDFSAFPLVIVNVPSGTSRLIQLGLAYESASSGLTLRYADSIQSLSPGTNEIVLEVTTIAEGEQGHVQGRYLSSPSGGPTGRLDVKVRPPNGRPSMTLMNTEIFSGWFQAFSMSGIDFEYVVNGTELLWGKGVRKSFFSDLQAASSPVMVETASGGYRVAGFFGSPENVSGKTAQAACASNEFSSCLSPNSTFRGPFMGSGGTLVSFSANTIGWNYLPGVSLAISGLRILYNPSIDPANSA